MDCLEICMERSPLCDGKPELNQNSMYGFKYLVDCLEAFMKETYFTELWSRLILVAISHRWDIRQRLRGENETLPTAPVVVSTSQSAPRPKP